jgi:2-iminobutanoate/2-iminopropanoate deaminase
VLNSSGFALSNVVKTRVYITTMSDFYKMDQIYGEFFNDRNNYPARVCVAMAALPSGGLVEIEAEAVK